MIRNKRQCWDISKQSAASLSYAVVLTASLSGLAGAKEAPPERLTIGYEDEGKIDASPQACLTWVNEETEGWSKTDLEKAARKTCAARKRHVEAYAALQSNYRTLMELLAQDVRLSPADAAANLKIMVKACIDHKFGITTGGHNIMIDVIENDISARCLTLGSNLIKDETTRFRKALTQGGFVP